MRVKMLGKITGTRDGVEWPEPGDEIVLPDEEGAQLCALGMATPIADPPKPETRKAAR